MSSQALTALLGYLLFFASTVSAQNNQIYALNYQLGPSQHITGLTGRLAVPATPSSGQYRLYPGIESVEREILQAALTSESKTWNLRSEWTGSDPSLPSSDVLNPTEGQFVLFDLKETAKYYLSTINIAQTFRTNQTRFAISDKVLSSAVFAIELSGNVYNFGPITFDNVQISATGTDASWCNDTPQNYLNKTRYTVTGAEATVGGGGVQCQVDSIVLLGPKSV